MGDTYGVDYVTGLLCLHKHAQTRWHLQIVSRWLLSDCRSMSDDKTTVSRSIIERLTLGSCEGPVCMYFHLVEYVQH